MAFDAPSTAAPRGAAVRPPCLSSVPIPSKSASLSPRLRLELAIEDAIALLDRMDGDPDLEDSADAEPSLCGVGMFASAGAAAVMQGRLEYDLEESADLL